MFAWLFWGVESLQPYPSRLMHRGLIFLLLISTILCGLLYLSSATWGGAASHPLSSTGILFELLNGRGVATGSNALRSTPFPAHESTCGGYMSREFPWMLSEWCSASMLHDQHSVCHTAPHLKVLYSQTKICKQSCRSTCTSWMFVGPGVF